MQHHTLKSVAACMKACRCPTLRLCSALQAPFNLDPRLPARAACAALAGMVAHICLAVDCTADQSSRRTVSALFTGCSAGPGGAESPAKWARLRAELLPVARQQAERAAQRSPLAGISSGALTCLALRQAGCTNLACTNLVGSSERGLQLKLCSRCKVGAGAECWAQLQVQSTCT